MTFLFVEAKEKETNEDSIETVGHFSGPDEALSVRMTDLDESDPLFIAWYDSKGAFYLTFE